ALPISTPSRAGQRSTSSVPLLTRSRKPWPPYPSSDTGSAVASASSSAPAAAGGSGCALTAAGSAATTHAAAHRARTSRAMRGPDHMSRARPAKKAGPPARPRGRSVGGRDEVTARRVVALGPVAAAGRLAAIEPLAAAAPRLLEDDRHLLAVVDDRVDLDLAIVPAFLRPDQLDAAVLLDPLPEGRRRPEAAPLGEDLDPGRPRDDPHPRRLHLRHRRGRVRRRARHPGVDRRRRGGGRRRPRLLARPHHHLHRH